MKVWIYKGDVSGSRAEREAQQAAARAQAARARGDRGASTARPERRPTTGGRPEAGRSDASRADGAGRR